MRDFLSNLSMEQNSNSSSFSIFSQAHSLILLSSHLHHAGLCLIAPSNCIFNLVVVGLQSGVIVLNFSLCIAKGLAVLAHALAQFALPNLSLLER